MASKPCQIFILVPALLFETTIFLMFWSTRRGENENAKDTISSWRNFFPWQFISISFCEKGNIKAAFHGHYWTHFKWKPSLRMYSSCQKSTEVNTFQHKLWSPLECECYISNERVGCIKINLVQKPRYWVKCSDRSTPATTDISPLCSDTSWCWGTKGGS